MYRLRTATAALIGVGLLAACNGGGGSGEGGALTWEDSPLNEYLEPLYGGYAERSDDEWQAQFDDEERRRQEIIAQCMTEQGFEYIPVDPGAGGGAVIVSESSWEDYGTVEWAAQYGYGIATMYTDQTEIVDDSGEGQRDPNEDIIAAMSESEQAAYWEALWGPEQEADEDGIVEYDPANAGCHGRAELEVYGDQDVDQAWNDPQFEDLFTAMDSVWEDLENHPEIAELNAAWNSCMADAGYPGWSQPWEAESAMHDEVNALWDEAHQDYDWESDDEPPMPDPAAMEEFKQREIAVAVADFGCRDDVDYEQESMRVQFEVEQAFVDANRAELDALIAAYGT